MSNKLHLAIIMDGNGRWAEGRNLPRIEGHKQGAKNVIELVKHLPQEVSIVTIYAFSTENWQRSLMEVFNLMQIAQEYFDKHLLFFIKAGIKLNFIGDHSILPSFIQNIVKTAELKTEHCTEKTLNIALSYGGRQEILQAIEKHKKTSEKLTEQSFSKLLNTGNLPDPDILIRTGGEKRLSNYLLWQLAYTELFFSDVLWPDFTIKHLKTTIAQYLKRDRRYGGIYKQ